MYWGYFFFLSLQATGRGAVALAAGGRCEPRRYQKAQRLFNQYLVGLWQAMNGFPAATTADDTAKEGNK